MTPGPGPTCSPASAPPDTRTTAVTVPLEVRDRLASLAAQVRAETGRVPDYGEVIEKLLDAAGGPSRTGGRDSNPEFPSHSRRSRGYPWHA